MLLNEEILYNQHHNKVKALQNKMLPQTSCPAYSEKTRIEKYESFHFERSKQACPHTLFKREKLEQVFLGRKLMSCRSG